MRILLLAGGWSTEREVSFSGARGIEAALRRLGHEVTVFDPQARFDALADAARACDFAFLNLHGSPGEDGLIQAMLEAAGCPYQGAGPAGSFLALNKAAAKQLFRARGLTTPNWEFHPVSPYGADSAWVTSLRYPLFVKANLGGSSLDMSQAAGPDELAAGLAALLAKGREVLIEEAADGVEVTCAVLGHEALPPILIKPAGGARFFDYTAKYQPQGAEELCPAPIDPSAYAAVQEAALAAHKVLGLCGCSRADFILTKDGPTLLEVNTLPGMTATSLLPKAAAAAGYSFDQLVARLIELGLEDCAGMASRL